MTPNEITLTFLMKLLEDSFDHARGHGTTASSSAPSDRRQTAYTSVAVGLTAYSSDDTPVIDPYKHPGIWAVFDDGCNSSCHGTTWAKDAAAKLAAGEFDMTWIHLRERVYNGLGGKATGKGKAIAADVGSPSRAKWVADATVLGLCAAGEGTPMPHTISLPPLTSIDSRTPDRSLFK